LAPPKIRGAGVTSQGDWARVGLATKFTHSRGQRVLGLGWKSHPGGQAREKTRREGGKVYETGTKSRGLSPLGGGVVPPPGAQLDKTTGGELHKKRGTHSAGKKEAVERSTQTQSER